MFDTDELPAFLQDGPAAPDPQYDWYRAAMAAKKAKQPLPPTSETACESGYYLYQDGKNGPSHAIALWRENGVLICLYNGEGIPADWAAKRPYPNATRTRWLSMCARPIEFADYDARVKTGAWPDHKAQTTAIRIEDGWAKDTKAPTETPPEAEAEEPTKRGVGDNSGGVEQPEHEALAERLSNLERDAKAFLADGAKIATEADATRATTLLKSIAKVRTAAEKKHKAEKGESDKRWKPIRKAAEKAEETLKELIEAFLKAQAETARIEAERVRAEAPRLAAEQKAAEAPTEVATPPIAEVKPSVRGSVGRAVSLRKYWIGSVTDYQAALQHYANHQFVKDAVARAVAEEARSIGVDNQPPFIPGAAFVLGERI